MDSLSRGEFGGIVIGTLIGGILQIWIILYGLRHWLRGPTKGSDINVDLENKVVIITGMSNLLGVSYYTLFVIEI